MIIVDTNIIAYFYISGEKSHLAEKLLIANTDWHAPAIWRSEWRMPVQSAPQWNESGHSK